MAAATAFGGGVRLRAALSGLLLAAVSLTLLALPDAADAKAKNASVMTRNLYLGAGLEPVILAPDVPAAEAAAGEVYEQMLASDFPARAKLIAKEFKQTKPDLIGLQEVTTWLQGPKDDPAAANVVIVDFLKKLQKEMKKLGLKYKTVVKQENTDAEVPTDKGLDVRLIDYDALMVNKKAVKVETTNGANFTTALSVAVAGGALGTVDVLRGFVEADVKVRGKPVHVVNTHLEAFLAGIRDAQADELLAAGGPLESTRPVILLGDLNSDPDGTGQGDSQYAYDSLIASGFVDRGITEDTCCFDADLLGGELTIRIDHVLTRPDLASTAAKRTGTKKKTKADQAPSDHAGVWSKLKVD